MKNYSYNSGQPVQKVVVLTLASAVALILQLQRKSQIFRADFTKRGDGTTRTMVCRCGVKKYLKGGKAAYNFTEKGLMSVYEFGKGYRSIGIDNLHFIKYAGVIYLFKEVGALTVGEHPAQMRSPRTIPASTSPMYTLAEA